MTWVRYYSKKIFGPYLGRMDPERAMKYMHVTRMVYFFSASSLGLLLWKAFKEIDPENPEYQKALESDKPTFIDHSEGKFDLQNLFIAEASVNLTKLAFSP